MTQRDGMGREMGGVGDRRRRGLPTEDEMAGWHH